MSLPRTRFDEAAGDFERQLLRAWQADRPSKRARRRVLALLGAGAALGATAATATAHAQAEVASAKIAGWGVGMVAKWLAVCAIAGTAVGVAAHEVRDRSADMTDGGSAVLSRHALSHDLIPRSPLARDQEPAAADGVPDVAPPVPTQRGDGARATATEGSPPSPGPRSTLRLGEQVATVSRARDALARGDAAEAIRLLEAYESAFPAGAFAEEARALREKAEQEREILR